MAPAILSGVGLLGSIFGGHSAPKNPYMPNVDAYLGKAGGAAGNVGEMGDAASQQYQTFAPQYGQAVQNYADYLEQDPYTDSYSTAKLNQATAGTTAAYQQAKARLASSMAARGMSNSGLAAGAESGIEQGYAQQQAQAQNALAMQKIADEGNRKGQLADLFGGAQQGAYGQAAGAYGNEAGIDRGIAGEYGNLGAQQQGYQAQADAAQNAAIGQSAGMLGTALGGLTQKKTSSDDDTANMLKLWQSILAGGGGS